MLQFQAHSRNSEARDFALLVDNNSYVQNWSLVQIIVILITCSIQVRIVFCCFVSMLQHQSANMCTFELTKIFSMALVLKLQSIFYRICVGHSWAANGIIHPFYNGFFFQFLQVYFVKKLFNINDSYGRAKI